MLDTVNTFFSPQFAGQLNLFEGLAIWQDEQFRSLQGSIPVIFLSLANVKETNFTEAVSSFKFVLERCYARFNYLVAQDAVLSENERRYFLATNRDMSDLYAKNAILCLSEYLFRMYKKRPIILLDEYDTPLHEAWVHGYLEKLLAFLRGFFNSTFKTNPYLGRGLLTGITQVGNDSIFSGMNNLEVVGIPSELYADCFGFTEKEVFSAMDEYGLTDKKEVKRWYDGFNFGQQREYIIPGPLSST